MAAAEPPEFDVVVTDEARLGVSTDGNPPGSSLADFGQRGRYPGTAADQRL